MLLQVFNPEIFTENWTAVALSALIAAVAIIGMFSASQMLSARRKSDVKLTTYECGIPATPYIWSNINVRFYVFAILFLIFDVGSGVPVSVGGDIPARPGYFVALLRHDAVPGGAGLCHRVRLAQRGA